MDGLIVVRDKIRVGRLTKQFFIKRNIHHKFLFFFCIDDKKMNLIVHGVLIMLE